MMSFSGSASLRNAITWCAGATMWCALVCPNPAGAATLSEKAKESGCVNKPIFVSGTRHLYRCLTESGAFSYFNVPDGVDADPPEKAERRNSTAPSPAGFPKVDSATQKGRDEVRRKVLSDELATEEQLLVEARVAYADGAPTALPEERANVEKYRERIAKLRQAVGVHERNIEALKKELTAGK
jgi:hypothetical protein